MEEGLLQVDYDGRLAEYEFGELNVSATGVCYQHPQEPRVGVPCRGYSAGYATLHASGAELDLHCRNPREEAGDYHWSAQSFGDGGQESEIESEADEAVGTNSWCVILIRYNVK